MKKKTTQYNYGLKFDRPDPEHYVFGASSIPFEILQEDGDWTPYLPVQEFQNLNGIETYACATVTLLNCVEILIKKQYGIERNYSDRFLANISGTKEGGNSPQVVCEFLRKIGVVEQDKWPFGPDINTFEKFYSPIPQALQELAKEFTDEWDFKHEFVPPIITEIQKALQCSPLMISVYAWVRDQNNLYYNPHMTDNHATTLIKLVPDVCKVVFDSYDPVIKDLKWSDTPTIVKRFYIKKKIVAPKNYWFVDIIKNLIDFILWR